MEAFVQLPVEKVPGTVPHAGSRSVGGTVLSSDSPKREFGHCEFPLGASGLVSE